MMHGWKFLKCYNHHYSVDSVKLMSFHFRTTTTDT